VHALQTGTIKIKDSLCRIGSMKAIFMVGLVFQPRKKHQNPLLIKLLLA
jgi:hypothetical protein